MSKDKFVPLREKGFKSTDCDFDHVSWDPKEIYNARALFLNLDKFDKFVKTLDQNLLLLLQELKIESENPELNISGFDKNGEATAGKAVSKNKSLQKSELAPLDQKNIAIKIAFKKIFEGLQEENINPKKINSEFAKEVDKELQAILIKLTLKKFKAEYSKVVIELKKAMIYAIPNLILDISLYILIWYVTTLSYGILKSYLELELQNGIKEFNFLKVSLLLLFAPLGLITSVMFVTSMLVTNSVVLGKKINSKKLLELLYLRTYWKKLALPIMMLMIGEPLVKENNTK